MIYDITKTTALLIIDAQNEYSDSERPLYVSDFQDTLTNINSLSKKFREQNLPVFLVKHIHDIKGNDVGRMGDFSEDEVFSENSSFSELDIHLIQEDSDIVIEKTRYSSFVNTKLESYLKTLNIDTLVITGFMTGYCSVTTTRHAHDLDYKTIYIKDANSMPYFGDLGFGDISVETITNTIATLLAGGVAEVISTNEAIRRV